SSDSRLQGAFQKGILALTYQGLFHFIVQQNGCSTVCFERERGDYPAMEITQKKKPPGSLDNLHPGI
ncbi:hypothetical protein L3W83_17065, partial [Escherichia coli]|nr:hypothetical protein [Escherichia coli]